MGDKWQTLHVKAVHVKAVHVSDESTRRRRCIGLVHVFVTHTTGTVDQYTTLYSGGRWLAWLCYRYSL